MIRDLKLPWKKENNKGISKKLPLAEKLKRIQTRLKAKG